MEFLLGIGVGVGLASVAGVRAFLPLVAALSVVLFAGFGSPPFLFMQMNDWLSVPVMVVLVILLVLECVLDKFTALDRPLNWAMVPVRAVSGATVFMIVSVELGLLDPLLGPMSSGQSLRLPGDISIFAPYLIAGAIIAGIVAVLKIVLRPPAQTTSAGVSHTFLSFLEDLIGLIGSVLAFVPFLPVLLVGFLLFFYARIRRRRGRKFGGLRILGD